MFSPQLLALARGEDVPVCGEEGEQAARRRRMELDAEARAALPSGRNFH